MPSGPTPLTTRTLAITAKPKASRASFGEALVDLANKYPQMVVLDADLSKSTMTGAFQKKYPERHLQLGIAESNLLGTAAGMALAGKIPVLTSFACFVIGRFETLRISIAYNKANVKIIGTHVGLGIGEDGYTQMALEDLGSLRSLPNMTIIQPADDEETKQAFAWSLEHKGPVYLRMTRQALEPVHEPVNYKFKFGKAEELKAGSQAVILASGGTLKNSLDAADLLSKQGISAGVANIATLMPLDKDYIAKLAGSKIKAIVTCEDHSPRGGLGSAVAEEIASLGSAVRVLRLGSKDYGESGTGKDLYKKHGLDPESISREVAKLVK